MVRLSRDFENDLLDELRTFAHCDFKRKDPNHFCSNREFQQNLKMSGRDVGKTLSNLVQKGKINRERDILVKGKRRDRFTVIDPRMYSSKEIIVQYRKFVNSELLFCQSLAEKMKKTPAYYDVKEEKIPIPVYKGKSAKWLMKNAKFVKPGATSRHGKINKKGYEYLKNFCDSVNRVFSYVDSLGYSQFAENIPQDKEHDKMINSLRKLVFDQTKFAINYVLGDLLPLQKQTIGEAILPRIPMMYQIWQIEKFARL
jgi:hypothetical protein